MNEKAKKKARQAELEHYLLGRFYKVDQGRFGDFVEWLEHQVTSDQWVWKDEAKELIALYEGG